MRSREKLEIVTLGSSSWMPYAPQGVKGTDDDDDVAVETQTRAVGYMSHDGKYNTY
jgi:hypothetical protein